MWGRFATVTVSTKRSAVVSGKRAEPTTYLTGIASTPLLPANSDRSGALMARLKLDTSHVLLETFVLGEIDIAHGDLLTVGGVDYVVRDVALWSAPLLSEKAMHITVEDFR